jgi:transcriptional regulator with XRE-family HTH domain
MAGDKAPRPGQVQQAEPGPRIGAQLRAVRLAARKSMAEVADQAGLTKGFLSKLERDLASVSVASLMRLCEALDISVGSLFSAPKGEVVRAGQYPPINFGGTGIREFLLTPSGEKRVQAILSEIEPGGGSGDEAYALPADVEFMFMLAGQVRIVVAGEELMLRAGDAFTFASGIGHSFGVPADAGQATVLWVISPALPDHGLDVQALARAQAPVSSPSARTRTKTSQNTPASLNRPRAVR